jgi:hypothetical protein
VDDSEVAPTDLTVAVVGLRPPVASVAPPHADITLELLSTALRNIIGTWILHCVSPRDSGTSAGDADGAGRGVDPFALAHMLVSEKKPLPVDTENQALLR